MLKNCNKKVENSEFFKRMYGIFGNYFRVATLSMSYLIVRGIIMQKNNKKIRTCLN